MSTPSFKGLHNQVKAKTLFVFYRYKDYSPHGVGLIAHDLAELLELPLSSAFDELKNLHKWKYIIVGITPHGRRQRIYKLSSKGEQWLTRWSPIIPWERYGWTAETIAEIDRKIKEIVDFRGYE
jgi:DNA-binding PadR family transcriptional regulator